LSAPFRYTTGGRDVPRAGRNHPEVTTMGEPAGRGSVSKKEIAVCGVDAVRCRACGACEEACPFSIPRVIVRRGAPASAEIDAGVCKGCGVCVAACPAHAVRQPGVNRSLPERRGRLLVIACARTGLFLRGGERVPAGATAMELPCAGGVSPAMILGALGRGFDGVLVMGRQQETCRLDGAEDHVRDLVVPRMEELSRRIGLGGGRVRFVEPAKGREGPIHAIEEHLAELAATPLREAYAAHLPTDSADDALAVFGWLAERGGVTVDAAQLDLLLGEWIAPLVLAEAGVGAVKGLSLVLAIDAAAKGAIDSQLAAAADGAREIAVGGLGELVQIAIAQRRGAWRTSHVRPVMP
jgi:coenzyme F420-reducing hydrogenase delta subunit/Pyruvate/2-oxoacid:ferredoxin oxidoreductase delta subunit